MALPPEARAALDLADDREPDLAQAVNAMLGSWRDGWPLTKLRALLASYPGTAADALDPSRPAHGTILKASDQDPLYRVLLSIISTAAEIPMDAGFRVVNPHAARYARQQAARLVTEVDNATRRAIRDIVRRGIEGELTVDQQARLLRDTIGLHPRQATAVSNLRTRLEAGTAANVEGVVTREGMTAAQIDRTVEAYARRQLALRAQVIAHHETMLAANRGLLAGWQSTDMIPEGAWIEWLVNPDESLCPECESIAEDVAENGAASSVTEGPRGARGVNGGTFSSDLGEYETPPAHVGCRCTLTLHLSEDEPAVGPDTVVTV